MTTALLIAKKQGKYTSGAPPYGYLKDPEDNYKLIVDEKVADNVRYIFQLLLEGHTLNESAKILNNEGVITARARRKEIKGYDAYANRWKSTVEETIWSHSMVRRIVKKMKHIQELLSLINQPKASLMVVRLFIIQKKNG